MNRTTPTDFQWQTQPAAAQWVDQRMQWFCQQDSFVADLRQRMLGQTGTRLVDWIDHFCLSEADSLAEFGYERSDQVWKNPLGIFPAVRVGGFARAVMAIKVDSVAEFLCVHQRHAAIEGQPGSPLRFANVSQTPATEFWVVERHGCDGFVPIEIDHRQAVAALDHAERLLCRRREFDTDGEGFEHAERLIDNAIDDLGVDWCCDLFFAAERRYWQTRNRAARVQKTRQDTLGLGWANHDHHTYRSSRQHFARLVGLLEQLGFECRERFYGGREAGWGAQVLEQPRAGIVIFADVDLSPAEVTGDFAHQGLSKREQLGTVGLWCKLHGEAVLAAGMHHLECRFDFDAARQQLADEGVQTMAPFTDFEFLKQAFTAGETWSVAEIRLERALADGSITAAQAQQFGNRGSIGSHLEILQRNDGYKGFNQTGISEIIRQTDPRRP